MRERTIIARERVADGKNIYSLPKLSPMASSAKSGCSAKNARSAWLIAENVAVVVAQAKAGSDTV